jgi:hypothetical protein
MTPGVKILGICGSPINNGNAAVLRNKLSFDRKFYAVNMVIASPDLGLQGGMAFSSLEGAGERGGRQAFGVEG